MWANREASPTSYRFRLKGTAAFGPLLMLTSGLLFAVMDCLIKISTTSFRIWDIAFYRFGIGMAILILLFGRHRNPFAGCQVRFLVMRGVAGSLSFLALIFAFQLIPIATALVLFYVFPAFAALFSALLFKEKLSKNMLWILVALGGVAVILDSRLQGSLLGQAMSLVGAALAGIALAAVKKARETNGPVIIYLYFCLAGVLISFIPFVSDPQSPSSTHEWLILGGIVGTSLIAQLLMNEGFRYCSSFEGSLLLTSEVPFATCWGIVFLHETVSWHFWVGATMIFASIIGLNRNLAFTESWGDGRSPRKPR